jgi:hypothetical protein
MWFNYREAEAQRKAKAESASRREREVQLLEDAGRLIAAWNKRQAWGMPMLFSPTVGAALASGHWFLWIRCPTCRAINAVDLRPLDRYREASVTNLVQMQSCRSCWPNDAPSHLVCLSKISVADEMRKEHAKQIVANERKTTGKVPTKSSRLAPNYTRPGAALTWRAS